MKLYRSVIRRMEEDNYKKGIVRVDMQSGYYKTGRMLYTLSLIWFMVFQTLFLFAHSMFMLSHDADINKTIDIPLLITSWSVFAALIAGFVLVCLRLNFIAVPLNIAACVVQMVRLYKNENVATYGFLENGILNNKYFWFYFAPAILIIVFSLFLLWVYINDRIHYRKDYSRTMASMLDDYKNEHPSVSDTEWQAHLEALDAEIDEEKAKNTKKSRK